MAFIGRVGMYVILATLGCGAWAQDYKPGEVIVKLKNKGAMSSYAFLGKAQTDKQMTLKESYGKMNMHHFALGKGTSVSQAIHDLSQDPDVEFVEPNYYLHKSDDTGIQERFSMAEIEEYAASSQEKNISNRFKHWIGLRLAKFVRRWSGGFGRKSSSGRSHRHGLANRPHRHYRHQCSLGEFR